MTAVNVVHREDAIFLLTDGAIYDDCGIVRGIGSKAVILAHSHSVVALRGPMAVMAALWFAQGMDGTTVDDVVRNLVSTIDQNLAALKVNRNTPGVDQAEMTVVGWSAARQRLEHYLLPFHHGYPDAPARQVTLRPNGCVSVAPPPALQARYQCPDVEAFDPDRDGLALMEAQRRAMYATANGDAFSGVGGFAQLTEITQDRISTRILHRPDRVGDKIDARDSGRLPWQRSVFAIS